ncbi:MAG: purine-nucleoside phosphorylase, partial [Synergistaceae bacterium]|nr:purine-nucleoside phosphorylase [Synergistaceae bacterium]
MLADKVSEACEYIKSRITREPAVALVLGSGLGSLADKLTAPEIIPYSDIPYWPRTTAIGHAGRLVAGRFDNSNTDVVIMQGRVHYYEGYTMSEVTFPTRVLAQLGVRSILFTNASGAVNPDIAPGTIVAIEDHINYMGTNPLIGINNDEWGPRFPDMTRAYDKKYISLLEKIAADNNITLKKGVYIAFSGPSFETPSEVRMAG